jgi:general secretion pathway protein L
VVRRRELAGGARSLAEIGPAVLTQAKAWPKATVGIRLQDHACLTRAITVPWTARGKLDGILALELERVTPFHRSEVHSGYMVASKPDAKGQLRVVQIILQRSRVDPAIAELRTLGVEVGGVECWNAAGTEPVAVNLLQPPADVRGRAAPRGAVLTGVLALGTLLLGATVVVLDFDRHERALGEIDARLSQGRKEIAALRKQREAREGVSSLAAKLLEVKRTTPSTVAVLEQLTGALSGDSWLTSLHVEGGTADLAGFAKSATALVTALQAGGAEAAGADGALRLEHARLTAPVIFDTSRKMEQFSLRLMLGTGRAEVPAPAASPLAAHAPAPATE